MEGADALLDAGVSVPLLSINVPLVNKRVNLRITMKRPCLSSQMKIAKLYLESGITSEEMWKFSKEQEMEFLVKHGSKIAGMIALTMRRGWKRFIPQSVIAWVVSHFMSNEHLLGAMKRFVTLMGTDPFIDIIKSAEMTNPMRLRMSQEKKGS